MISYGLLESNVSLFTVAGRGAEFTFSRGMI